MGLPKFPPGLTFVMSAKDPRVLPVFERTIKTFTYYEETELCGQHEGVREWLVSLLDTGRL